MIFKLLHTIFPPKIGILYRKIYTRLYSGWIQYEFHSHGKHCIFGKFLLLQGGQHIDLADFVSMGRGLVVEAFDQFHDQSFTPCIKIGNYVNIGDYSHLSCANSIIIKDNVRMGRKVFITDNSHGSFTREQLDIRPNYRPLISKGPVIIEENVWIGEMVCIMPGVTIGRGSIIGANAVVTKSIPPYSIAAGVPAKVIKQL
jgi:acetyltransferase-like isoleucine patch superfamily enzyme